MVRNSAVRVFSTNQRELSHPRPKDLKSVLRIQADLASVKTRIFLTHDPPVFKIKNGKFLDRDTFDYFFLFSLFCRINTS